MFYTNSTPLPPGLRTLACPYPIPSLFVSLSQTDKNAYLPGPLKPLHRRSECKLGNRRARDGSSILHDSTDLPVRMVQEGEERESFAPDLLLCVIDDTAVQIHADFALHIGVSFPPCQLSANSSSPG